MNSMVILRPLLVAVLNMKAYSGLWKKYKKTTELKVIFSQEGLWDAFIDATSVIHPTELSAVTWWVTFCQMNAWKRYICFCFTDFHHSKKKCIMSMTWFIRTLIHCTVLNLSWPNYTIQQNLSTHCGILHFLKTCHPNKAFKRKRPCLHCACIPMLTVH